MTSAIWTQTIGRVILVAALLPLVACKKNNLDSDNSSLGASVDPVEASIESGITMISGIADDQTSNSYAALSSKSNSNIWQALLIPQAVADNCSRAFQATCNSGVKTANYSGCNPAGTSRTVDGFVTLTYSHTSCTLATDGDSVVRSYDLGITGPRGGVVSHSSAVASDYRGTSFGGGGKLTKTSSGWDMEILGRHSSLSYRDRELLNVSTRTLAPVSVSGSLSRTSRLVNGGQIEVNHNLAKFTAVISPSNLQWSASCCHPVSGSLAVTYSGSKTGSATVTFQGCGSANVVQDGQSSAIAMSYCE